MYAWISRQEYSLVRRTSARGFAQESFFHDWLRHTTRNHTLLLPRSRENPHIAYKLATFIAKSYRCSKPGSRRIMDSSRLNSFRSFLTSTNTWEGTWKKYKNNCSPSVGGSGAGSYWSHIHHENICIYRETAGSLPRQPLARFQPTLPYFYQLRWCTLMCLTGLQSSGVGRRQHMKTGGGALESSSQMLMCFCAIT